MCVCAGFWGFLYQHMYLKALQENEFLGELGVISEGDVCLFFKRECDRV